MFRIFCILIGYAVGCLQTAYIVSKAVGKIDIREHGSGNAGTTNVVRVLGPRIGVVVFASDVLKAVLGFVVAALIFKGSGSFFLTGNPAGLLPGFYGGLGVVLGHNFPFYLKFKGGKGIASTLGVILCVDWRAALIAYVIGIMEVASTRFISLASLTITLLFPFLLIFFGHSPEEVALAFFLMAMAWYQHRENIKRLLAGNERKFSFSSGKK